MIPENDYFLISVYIAVILGVIFHKLNLPEKYLSKTKLIKYLQILFGFILSIIIIFAHKYGYERYINEFLYNFILLPIAFIIFIKIVGIIFDNVWLIFSQLFYLLKK